MNRGVSIHGLRLASCLAVTVLAGCPSQVEREFGQPRVQPQPQAKEGDPDVVKVDGELYPAETIKKQEAREPPPTRQTPGVGKPDETNGVCRLYAPKLKDPQCCKADYGLDAEAARTACGHDIYLGESFQGSCGYYFNSPTGTPAWIRLGFVPHKTAKEAADAHQRVMRERIKKPDFAVTPIPGIKGAYWGRDDTYGWAFLPGFSKPRQLSWRKQSCTEDGLLAVIKQLVSAKQPPQGAERLALVPKAHG